MNTWIATEFGSNLKAGLLCAVLVAAPLAVAEDAPPSYIAFPGVYKLVQENEHFRVIEATWQPGQRDAMHSHLPAVIYWISDCQLSADLPDGKRIEGAQKAGTSRINPAVPGHVATNMGQNICKALLVRTEVVRATRPLSPAQ